MEVLEDSEVLKDILNIILPIISPIAVAVIGCISTKKSKAEMQREIEKSLREKDAETFQIIQKINAELESQKQLISWNNSMPQTNKYTELADAERYGNICSLEMLANRVEEHIDTFKPSVNELNEIKKLLGKIKLPLEEETLFAYEIPYIISYKRLIRKIDDLIQDANNNSQ